MSFKKISAFFTAFLFCACSQTVSNSNSDSSSEEDGKEDSQYELPTDSSGNIIAPALKKISVADDGSDEAKEYFKGVEKADFLEQYQIHGTDDLKDSQIKEMEDTLQKGLQHFDLAAKSDKWFVPATVQKGNLYLIAIKTLEKQDHINKDLVDLVVESLSIIKQAIAYYEQARSIFQQGIDAVRGKKIQDENCQILEEYFINTYFDECEAYRDMATLYREHPLPDSAAVVKEYVEYDKASMEDAIEMTHEDLEAYREELSSKSKDAKGKAVSACESGVLEAKKYNLKNDRVEAIKGLLRLLDPESPAL